MKVTLREIKGPWDAGWVLDKHSVSSTPVGTWPNGRTRFETIRTDVGEATYQLKYNYDFTKVDLLAQTLVDEIFPRLKNVGFIVPMPATNARARQPVTEVALAVGARVGLHVATELLLKAPGGQPLKNLGSKEEKLAAIGDSFSIVDRLNEGGPWNVLVVDDLFDSGASMEAACKVLRGYRKVGKIYVAALTWM